MFVIDVHTPPWRIRGDNAWKGRGFRVVKGKNKKPIEIIDVIMLDSMCKIHS
jgi:hypothetical protein